VLGGRRFINLVGPFGPGIQSPNDIIDSAGTGAIDLLGNEELRQALRRYRSFFDRLLSF